MAGKTMRWLAPAVLAMAMLVVGCGRGKGEKSARMSADLAVMPGANLVLNVDLQGARQAAIYQAVAGLGRDDLPAAEAIEEMERLASLAQQHLGLGEGDVLRLLVAGRSLNDDFEAMVDAPLANAELAIGLQLAKPVTLDQLATFIEAAARENGEALALARSTVSGVAVLQVNSDEEDAPLFLAAVGDGKVLLGGTRSGLENALARAAGKPVAVGAMQTATGQPAGSVPHFLLALALSQTMRQALDAELARMAVGNPMGATLAKSLRGLSGAAVRIDFGDQMAIGLHAKLGSAEQAEMLRNVLDNMVLSGLKMFMSMAAGGQPLPVIETMQAVADADTARLTLALTLVDVATLKAMATAADQ